MFVCSVIWVVIFHCELVFSGGGDFCGSSRILRAKYFLPSSVVLGPTQCCRIFTSPGSIYLLLSLSPPPESKDFKNQFYSLLYPHHLKQCLVHGGVPGYSRNEWMNECHVNISACAVQNCKMVQHAHMGLWLGGAWHSFLLHLLGALGWEQLCLPLLSWVCLVLLSCCRRPGIGRGPDVLWSSQPLWLCSLQSMAVFYPVWAPSVHRKGQLCLCGPRGFFGIWRFSSLLSYAIVFIITICHPLPRASILLLDLEVCSHFWLSDWFLNKNSLLIVKNWGCKTVWVIVLYLKIFQCLETASLLALMPQSRSGCLPWLCRWLILSWWWTASWGHVHTS